jgi:hypothetical protein
MSDNSSVVFIQFFNRHLRGHIQPMSTDFAAALGRHFFWGFLLDVAFANSFILQLKTPCPNWMPCTTHKDCKECIYNAIFNVYAQESRARKRNRTGKEEDTNDIETQQKHMQRKTTMSTGASNQTA